MSIKQYDTSDHPYHLPDQIDIFTWSMPFLAEKVVQMLHHIVSKGGEYGGDVDLKQLEDKLAANESTSSVWLICVL